MVVTGSGEKSSLLLTVMLSVVPTTGPWWLLSCSLLAFLACFLKKPNMLRASSPTSGVSLADAPKEAHGRRRAWPPGDDIPVPRDDTRAPGNPDLLDLSPRATRCIALADRGSPHNVKTTSAHSPILILSVLSKAADASERARLISHRFTRCLFWGLVSFLHHSLPSLLWPPW